jgi:hypothetical protein
MFDVLGFKRSFKIRNKLFPLFQHVYDHTDVIDKETHSELCSKMNFTAAITSGDDKVPSRGQLVPRAHFK